MFFASIPELVMEGEVKRKRYEADQLPVPDDPNPDPFADLINEGRVHIRPTSFYAHPTVLTIDLDLLAARLIDRLTLIYTYPIFFDRYTDAEVAAVVTNMVNAAMLITYNRLRAIALRYSSQVFQNQMRHRAPIGNGIEFPAFLASALSSIGPLRVKDAPVDSLIIYATPASKMETYGRSGSPQVEIGYVERFLEELRRLKVRLAPIDVSETSIGSFFTTIEPCLRDALWSFDGMLHPTHYENEDIMRAYLCLHPDLDCRGLDQVSMTVEFCTNQAVVAAVRAARPEGVAVDVNGDDQRVFHRHISFPVNLFGIRPAGGGGAEGGEQGEVAGVYIVGRGNRTYYATSLAHNLCEYQLVAALRYRLMSTS